MRDLVQHGLNRLVFQFKQSEKLKGFINTQLDSYQELDNTLNDLFDDRLLDNAVGKQLDGLGEILGLPRPLLPIDVLNVFGFLTDPTSLSFGDINNPSVGGNFVDFAATRQIADDETYRKLLRAKAVINRTSMTVEETLGMISLMFDGARVRYTLTVNLQPQYTIEKVLNPSEIALLGLLPILIGLGNINYIAIDAFDAFGFLGDSDAKGFTSISDTSLGGNFAIII